MINDQKLLKFIDHVESRLAEIADNTKPVVHTVNVEAPAAKDPADIYPIEARNQILDAERVVRGAMTRLRDARDEVEAAAKDLSSAEDSLAEVRAHYSLSYTGRWR